MQHAERHIILDNRFEAICHKSGLFQSSVGKLLNADVNGALGISLKKVSCDSFLEKIVGSSCVFQPYRINIL